MKCGKCGMDAEGWKCAKCGHESAENDPSHTHEDAESMMAKCTGCNEAEANCTCETHSDHVHSH